MMVTQDLLALHSMNKMKVKKNKKKKAKKKKKKKVLENAGSESETDNLDLSQELYPLSHYVSDQEELVAHMFTTIQGKKLEAMLPPILKGIPIKELKRLCLHELRGMSKKRVLCCINGQVMEGSSGSEDDEEEEQRKDNSTPGKEGKSEENAKVGEKRKSSSSQIPEAILQKKIKVEPGLDDGTGSQVSGDSSKSVLELLELEMRARIIKTMLGKGDDGKKITEDAIAAVMRSAKQVTQEGGAQHKSEKDAAHVVADTHTDVHKSMASEHQVPDERDKDGKTSGDRERGRSTRRKHHRPKEGDDRREPRSKVRGRRVKSNSGSYTDSKHLKEGTSSERPVAKRKKITRKEFEERMKRAKKNRTYRQRKSSEDEEKTNENDAGEKAAATEGQENEGGSKEECNAEVSKITNNSEVARGEASEKEEGEIDSNEEEEGACTPSDVSSVSYYSSSSGSKSGSRSYSRSSSRSPVRRKRRNRSYTPSRSRSRSLDRSSRDTGKQSYGRRSREQSSRNDDTPKKTLGKVSLRSPKQNKEEEDNWGQKCDIEFVDSEEDFDDHPDTAKKDPVTKKPVPEPRGELTERASISFSLQKKPAPNITPGVDLDDLPLKKRQMTSGNLPDIKIVETNRPTKKISDEIVISSDSDSETKKKLITESTVVSSDSEPEVQVKLARTGKVDKKKMALPDTKQKTPQQTTPPQSEEDPKVSRSGISSLNDEQCKANNTVPETQSGVMPLPQTLESSTKNGESEKIENIDRSIFEQAEIGRNLTYVDDVKQSDTDTTSVEQTCVDVTALKNNVAEHLGLAVDEQRQDGNENKAVLIEKEGDVITPSLVAAKKLEIHSVDDALEIEQKSKVENESDGVGTDESQDESSTDKRDHVGDDENISENVAQGDHHCNDSDPVHVSDITVKLQTMGHVDPVYTQSCTSATTQPEQGIDQTHKDKNNEPHVECNVPANESLENGKEGIPVVLEKAPEHSHDSSFDQNPTSTDECEDVFGRNEMPLIHVTSVVQDGCLVEQEVTAPVRTESEGDTSINKGDTDIQQRGQKEGRQVPDTNDYAEESVGGSESVVEVGEGDNSARGEYLVPEKTATVADKQEKLGNAGDTAVLGTVTGVQQTDQEEEEHPVDNFYRGADQLTFSDNDDEGTTNDDQSIEELLKDDSPVEPIRIETGMIRKRVLRSRKVEEKAPDKSWTKREKKKKEKSKDTLVMESMGFLKSALSETTQSPLMRENEGGESVTNPPEERMDGDETQSSSVASASETDHSLMTEDGTPASTTQDQENEAFVASTEESAPRQEGGEPKERNPRRIDQETEIIGVIETSKDSSLDTFDDADLGGSSWSMRWLQSEKVQKVVSSSKMLSRVRKKIQKKDKAIKTVTAEKTDMTQEVAKPSISIIGSIEEYERLFGMKVKATDDAAASATADSPGTAVQGTSGEQPQPGQESVVPQASKKAAPAFGSDDDDEDSEEEALWSKILKKS